jgi:hypothetical protein
MRYLPIKSVDKTLGLFFEPFSYRSQSSWRGMPILRSGIVRNHVKMRHRSLPCFQGYSESMRAETVAKRRDQPNPPTNQHRLLQLALAARLTNRANSPVRIRSRRASPSIFPPQAAAAPY